MAIDSLSFSKDEKCRPIYVQGWQNFEKSNNKLKKCSRSFIIYRFGNMKYNLVFNVQIKQILFIVIFSNRCIIKIWSIARSEKREGKVIIAHVSTLNSMPSSVVLKNVQMRYKNKITSRKVIKSSHSL